MILHTTQIQDINIGRSVIVRALKVRAAQVPSSAVEIQLKIQS